VHPQGVVRRGPVNLLQQGVINLRPERILHGLQPCARAWRRCPRMKNSFSVPRRYRWNRNGWFSKVCRERLLQSRWDCITQPRVGPIPRGPTLGSHI
jgi:hypothetical protein